MPNSPSDPVTMLEALTKCRDKFRFYADQHRMKSTAEGDEKADRNTEMADMCDGALEAHLSASPAGDGWVLVPRKAIPKMHRAAWSAFENDMKMGADFAPLNQKVWSAMLAAAPPAKQTGEV